MDVPSITITQPSNSNIQQSIAVMKTFEPSPDAKSRDRAMTLDSLTIEVSLFQYM